MADRTFEDIIRERLSKQSEHKQEQEKAKELVVKKVIRKDSSQPKGEKIHYRTSIKHRLYDKDVLAMFHSANNNQEKFLIAILYRTGARPSELLELTKDKITYDDLKLRITILTIKLGMSKKPMQDERLLEFERGDSTNRDILLEFIIKYTDTIREGQVLHYTTRWMEMKIEEISQRALGYSITPYHLRHSCFNNLSQKGYNQTEIMHFKGAADVRSVSYYLHAQPFVVRPLSESQTPSE